MKVASLYWFMNHLQDFRGRHSSFTPETKLFNRDIEVLSTAEHRTYKRLKCTNLPGFWVDSFWMFWKEGETQCNCSWKKKYMFFLNIRYEYKEIIQLLLIIWESVTCIKNAIKGVLFTVLYCITCLIKILYQGHIFRWGMFVNNRLIDCGFTLFHLLQRWDELICLRKCFLLTRHIVGIELFY